MLKYGVERKVTHHSTLGATMAFGLPIGVTLTIKVTRGQQTYLFPLHLADEVGIGIDRNDRQRCFSSWACFEFLSRNSVDFFLCSGD